jgi:deoxyribonuclease IV
MARRTEARVALEHFIGAHTSNNGGIDMAVRRAAAADMTALQVFTTIPKFYGDRASIRPERVERFRSALAETRIRSEHVLVHAAYVLGVATADDHKWQRSAAGLRKEMERSTAIGAGAVCFHSGSADDDDPHAAARRIARAMTEALRAVPGDTRLLVENTAGGGRTMARSAEEVGEILAYLPDDVRERAGYGLDTCHLYASGYDIGESRHALSAILDAFQDAAGGPPRFFHLNDSEGELGSNRDRHALIGEGAIGEQAFRWLLHDRRSAGIPLILETPTARPDVADDDPSPDPNEVRMVRLLRSMMGED